LGDDHRPLRTAVFFDRDGVVNELVPDPVSGLPESPLAPEQVTLVPGSAAALRRLHEAGYVLVGTSNQPAAAKGTAPLEALHAVQARVLQLLELQGVVPDGFRLCFHHPEGTVAGLTGECDCRKPAPGMLLAAAEELDLDLARSWIVGDTDADVLAGAAAGCRTILVEHPGSAHKRVGAASPGALVSDLDAAVRFILIRDSG
jgi:D-glycero-D-manno-heptose 1,7-bisphosphate phosphatase